MVFVTLRELIGEPAFLRGARGCWNSKRFQVASWSDLRAAFERASGRPLGGFFAQWVDRAGAPELRIVRAQAFAANGSYELKLTLAQSVPAYRLCVPLEIVSAEPVPKTRTPRSAGRSPASRRTSSRRCAPSGRGRCRACVRGCRALRGTSTRVLRTPPRAKAPAHSRDAPRGRSERPSRRSQRRVDAQRLENGGQHVHVLDEAALRAAAGGP